MADVVEDRIISEEYKLWKKNNPFMYDFMMTRILEYPAPSVEWFNEVEKIDDDPRESILQRLLFGTNTGSSQEENFLVVASVMLPGYIEPPKVDLYSMREDAFGSFIYYNDQLEIDFKLNHEGVVTCARYMPKKSNVIATKSSTDLFIYDIKDCFEDFDLAENTEPIYSYYNLNSQSNLDWNPEYEGFLLTSFEGSKIAIWDVNSQKKKKALTPKNKFGFISGDESKDKSDVFIYDASWHRKHPDIVGAASSNGGIMLWDIRSKSTNKPSHYFNGHKGSSFQIKFNPFSEYVFITSGSDCQIAAWDIRNLNIKLHSIQLKNEKFYTLKWSPHCETLFAATTNDRKIYLFDLDRILDDLLPQEVEDGPSTLTFIHGGHTAKVYDFDWNPNDANPLMICSVSDDNVFQIWQMTNKFLIKDNLKADV